MTTIIIAALFQYAAALAVPAEANAISMSESLSDHGYEQIGEDKRVVVYRDESRRTIVLAAEGDFSSPPLKILDWLLDYPAHVGVVDNVAESSILQRGKNWILVYEKLKLPVISNRDNVLMVRWGVDGDTAWLTFDAVEGRGPEVKSGTVRIKHHHGSWQLRPRADGRGTDARFQVDVDFGGNVPMWMVSSGAADKLPDLFEAFRRQLGETE